MEKEYLPLGSVVILKNGLKKIMITGQNTIDNETKKEFDYNGCIWPEGYMENIFCLFNNDEIDQVFFRGYEANDSKQLAPNRSQLSNKAKNNDNYEEKYRPGRAPKEPSVYTSAEEMIEKYGESVNSLDEFPDEVRERIIQEMEREN